MPPSSEFLESETAVELVDRYLQLCEQRELDAARQLLAEHAVLIFPGAVRHSTLEDIVADASARYRHVAKNRQHVTVGVDGQGRQTVTHAGVLQGENVHGVPFEGIRYLDLFILQGDRIVEQHVYNDLAVGDALTRVSAPPERPAEGTRL